MIPDTGTALTMLEQPQRLDMVYSVPIDTYNNRYDYGWTTCF